MHVGHFAAGFIGKRIEPPLSVGTLVLAAMLTDRALFSLIYFSLVVGWGYWLNRLRPAR